METIAGLWSFLTVSHPSTDHNETRTWSSISPWEPSHKIWYKSVHNLFSYRGHRQTVTQTNAGKTYSLAFSGRTTLHGSLGLQFSGTENVV